MTSRSSLRNSSTEENIRSSVRSAFLRLSKLDADAGADMLASLDEESASSSPSEFAKLLDTLQQTVLEQCESLREAKFAGQLGVAVVEKNAELRRQARDAQTRLDELERENKELTESVKALEATGGSGDGAEQIRAQAKRIGELEQRVEDLETVNGRYKKLLAEHGARETVLHSRRESTFEQLQWENAHLTTTLRSIRRVAPTQRATSPQATSPMTSPAVDSRRLLQKQALPMARGRRARPSLGAMTLKRNFQREEEDRILFEEASQWVHDVVGAPLEEHSLETGVLLCQLLRKVEPKLNIGRIHKKAKPGSFLAHDNVQAFLVGCKKLGVPDHALFSSSDLLGNIDRRAVANGLLALSKIAVAYGVKPPPLVQMELDIDRIRNERATAKAAEAAKRRAAGQAEPASGADDDGVHLEDAADSPRFSPYEAAPGDDVDAAMAEACNDMHIKDKPVRVGEGEYRIGHQVVFVRPLRGSVLVRHRDEWKELRAFLSEFIKERMADRARARRAKEAAAVAKVEGVKKEAPTADDAAAPAAGGDEDAVEDEDVAPRSSSFNYDVTAYKEFFFLTALSVKLNHSLKEENICMVSTEKLFERAVEQGVPFHSFASWIERELTKAYLEAIIVDRESLGLEPSRVSTLRETRRRAMTAINARPKARVRAGSTYAEDELDEEEPGIFERLSNTLGLNG